MRRLNISAKIWLSAGIFVLGSLVTIVMGQVKGLQRETVLRATSEALFPAAQASQDAAAGFQQVVKGFSDAVMVQDASGLDRATEQGRQVLSSLQHIASTAGLPAERTDQARELARAVDQFLSDARSTYAAVLANPAGITPELQQRMRDLAGRTDTLKASLTKTKEQLSKDLHQELEVLAQQSAFERWTTLGLFGLTFVVAAVIVNITIRRAITGPITRVIYGVKEAADGATAASDRMANSGEVVAREAQEQAACIQETSASLDEISATTRENATRAGEADRLMQQAREKVDTASHAMDDLKESMTMISKSSQQVSAVLKSIDEIAFHTNILALNAAVEAARAGAAGAGFSVVADEVRSLAQRAADAARRSADIIEKTILDVTKGEELVLGAHASFQQVSDCIANSSNVVSQIALSSNEQARGIDHIGTAMARISSVTENNVANAQQTAETASAMSRQVLTTREHLDELMAVVGLRAE